MVDLKVGKGPYFTLFRPYHLTSLEVPLSAARAVLYRAPTWSRSTIRWPKPWRSPSAILRAGDSRSA